MNRIIISVILFLGFSAIVFADNELYHFSTPEQKTRFTYLTEQYRCLVCQNETLADSNAPLAVDLKDQIASLIQQGKDDQAITHYLVQRYGDFVLFHPPLKTITYALWFGPFLLLLVGALVLVSFVRSRKNSQQVN